MKLSRVLFLVPLATLVLAGGPVVHAATVNGTVYESDTFFGFPLMNDLDFFGDLFEALPTNGIAAQESFTVTNSNPNNLFSFYLGAQSNDLGLNGFLTAGQGVVGGADGQSVTASSTTPLVLGGTSVDNAVFDFTGQTYLVAGTTYSFYSDDGMYLCISASTSNCLGVAGDTVISAGWAESATEHSFTVANSGDYDFNLLYAETNGAPAELEGNLGTLVAAPEPSGLVLLGSGILAAAGMVRRRLCA
jgi:hypothetical protein